MKILRGLGLSKLSEFVTSSAAKVKFTEYLKDGEKWMFDCAKPNICVKHTNCVKKSIVKKIGLDDFDNSVEAKELKEIYHSDKELYAKEMKGLYNDYLNDRFDNSDEAKELYSKYLNDEKRWVYKCDDKHCHGTCLCFNRRVNGLFKVEAEGLAMICIASKTYFMLKKEMMDDDVCLCSTKPANCPYHKICSKGNQIAKNANVLNFNTYYNAVVNNKPQATTNSGFRVIQKSELTEMTQKEIDDGMRPTRVKLEPVMLTYEQTKLTGLNPCYDKRVVMADGIHTYPLFAG